ncbi:hypothetical protein M2432_004472 [Mycobacterium sp. OTB74]|nr:hypothetical protein [Mycobacterium sp. OTB74]
MTNPLETPTLPTPAGALMTEYRTVDFVCEILRRDDRPTDDIAWGLGFGSDFVALWAWAVNA